MTLENCVFNENKARDGGAISIKGFENKTVI